MERLFLLGPLLVEEWAQEEPGVGALLLGLRRGLGQHIFGKWGSGCRHWQDSIDPDEDSRRWPAWVGDNSDWTAKDRLTLYLRRRIYLKRGK